MYSFFLFIIGLCLGSFLNVCIYRLPRYESILYPASHCPKCDAKLKFFDLIPVLSFVIAKGKCRYCGENISLRYPVVEILTAFIFVLIFNLFFPSHEFFLYLFFSIALIISFFSDLETEIIPDSVSILGCIPAILISALNNNAQKSLLGMIFGFSFMYLILKITSFLYKKETMGEGDVKFLMMIGAYIGWSGALISFLFASILGAIVGIFLVIIKRKRFGEHIPFGPFLSLGAFIYLFFGKIILSFYKHLVYPF